MKRISVLALCIAGLVSSCDKDDDDQTNDVNATDRSFTMMAAMSNTAETDAGQLASIKAQNTGIRQYGMHMVSEHTTSQDQLQSLAGDLGLVAPDSLDAEHMMLKTQLQSLNGRSFDSVYIHAQVRDHQRTIALFENQINAGENSRLRDFAREQMPHLREHLDMADSLAALY